MLYYNSIGLLRPVYLTSVLFIIPSRGQKSKGKRTEFAARRNASERKYL